MNIVSIPVFAVFMLSGFLIGLGMVLGVTGPILAGVTIGWFASAGALLVLPFFLASLIYRVARGETLNFIRSSYLAPVNVSFAAIGIWWLEHGHIV